jgi:hypothetical protein
VFLVFKCAFETIDRYWGLQKHRWKAKKQKEKDKKKNPFPLNSKDHRTSCHQKKLSIFLEDLSWCWSSPKYNVSHIWLLFQWSSHFRVYRVAWQCAVNLIYSTNGILFLKYCYSCHIHTTLRRPGRTDKEFYGFYFISYFLDNRRKGMKVTKH